MAQMLISLIPLPYTPLHTSLVVTVTSTSMRTVGWFPPELRVPQPETVATCPANIWVAVEGRQAGLMALVKVTGSFRVRMEKSLRMLFVSYRGSSLIDSTSTLI